MTTPWRNKRRIPGNVQLSRIKSVVLGCHEHNCNREVFKQTFQMQTNNILLEKIHQKFPKYILAREIPKQHISYWSEAITQVAHQLVTIYLVVTSPQTMHSSYLFSCSIGKQYLQLIQLHTNLIFVHLLYLSAWFLPVRSQEIFSHRLTSYILHYHPLFYDCFQYPRI